MANGGIAALALAACFGLAVPVGCTGPRSVGLQPEPAAGRPGQNLGVVVEVVDGDTLEVEFGGRTERVRLLGIDAPESVHPTVPVQCFGPESAAELAAALPPGSEVRVERDVEARDRYGRLLLYVFRSADDLFVNGWLVRNGLADTSFYEPNTALAPSLTRARSSARAERAGLWGRCDGPDQPVD